MADDRLSIAVEHADGRVTRWGYDEVDGKNIPTDLSFGTKIPGGYEQMSCSLLRRIDQDHPDLDPFDTVTVYGPGGRIAYQGRHVQFPRSHGDSFSITPGAVGWSVHLRDDPTFTFVYIDRDLSHWTGPSRERRVGILLPAVAIGNDPQITPGTSTPALLLSQTGPWADPSGYASEAIYTMPAGRVAARVRCEWILVPADANFSFQGFATTDEISVSSATADQIGTSSGAFNYAPNTPLRKILLQFAYPSGPAGADGTNYELSLTDLRVMGNDSLGVTGTGAVNEGVLASDVIAHVLSETTSLLSYTTGAGGSIESTSFPIPHLAYLQPTTADAVISDINKYHLYDWGVFDNREFFFRAPDPDRLCWEARLGDGAYMTADGLSGEQVINGVAVTYQDGGGATYTVGPPGGNFDTTSSDLQDTSDTNPANTHGITRKWDNLSLSFPSTENGAIQIGTVYLAERSLATRRGSLTLTGLVQHPTEGKVPVWRVRAGDWIRVTDLNGGNATVQRKIISTNYSHASRSITLELDNTPAKLSAILERVGIQTGIATGGGF